MHVRRTPPAAPPSRPAGASPRAAACSPWPWSLAGLVVALGVSGTAVLEPVRRPRPRCSARSSGSSAPVTTRCPPPRGARRARHPARRRAARGRGPAAVRRLLESPALAGARFVPARVVAVGAGGPAGPERVTIDAGSRDGVAVDRTVVAAGGSGRPCRRGRALDLRRAGPRRPRPHRGGAGRARGRARRGLRRRRWPAGARPGARAARASPSSAARHRRRRRHHPRQRRRAAVPARLRGRHGDAVRPRGGQLAPTGTVGPAVDTTTLDVVGVVLTAARRTPRPVARAPGEAPGSRRCCGAASSLGGRAARRHPRRPPRRPRCPTSCSCWSSRWALLRGPVAGALVGLAAGWVVDLVPPGRRTSGVRPAVRRRRCPRGRLRVRARSPRRVALVALGRRRSSRASGVLGASRWAPGRPRRRRAAVPAHRDLAAVVVPLVVAAERGLVAPEVRVRRGGHHRGATAGPAPTRAGSSPWCCWSCSASRPRRPARAGAARRARRLRAAARPQHPHPDRARPARPHPRPQRAAARRQPCEHRGHGRARGARRQRRPRAPRSCARRRRARPAGRRRSGAHLAVRPAGAPPAPACFDGSPHVPVPLAEASTRPGALTLLEQPERFPGVAVESRPVRSTRGRSGSTPPRPSATSARRAPRTSDGAAGPRRRRPRRPRGAGAAVRRRAARRARPHRRRRRPPRGRHRHAVAHRPGARVATSSPPSTPGSRRPPSGRSPPVAAARTRAGPPTPAPPSCSTRATARWSRQPATRHTTRTSGPAASAGRLARAHRPGAGTPLLSRATASSFPRRRRSSGLGPRRGAGRQHPQRHLRLPGELPIGNRGFHNYEPAATAGSASARRSSSRATPSSTPSRTARGWPRAASPRRPTPATRSSR